MAGIAPITRDLSQESFAEEKFRLAVEACPNGMVVTDDTGRILLVNGETERMFGYQREELLSRTIDILVPERLRNAHLQHRARFTRQPEIRRLGANRDFFGRRRDGSEFPVEIGLNPIRAREGLLVLSVIIDISERKRIDRLKDEFVSTVSHELRTPLTSIVGSLSLLIGGAAGTLPEPAMRLIGIAQANSRRLVRLINDILDIEKIESGQIAFSFKRLSARSLVEQVIEANRGYADGFEVRVRLDNEAAASEVYVDADRFAQVITNLLSNAVKFSPPGGEVLVTIAESDQTVRVAVRDHGAGIPREFRPRIFEKFAQADTTDARRKGGTGLGLSIAKQIVTRMGGSVGFEDAVGGGTIFYVGLPAWARVAARENDPDQKPQAPQILLCEDDPDVAMALRDGLRPFEFSTDFAHSAADAMTRAQAKQYAAILVDFDLPDGDGIDLIRRLREQPQTYRTPIVVMSAAGGWEKSDIHSSECLEKPVDVERLAQILNRALACAGDGRPQILHADDDQQVLALVARALGPTAAVVSVDSIEDARHALRTHQFDLAILDVMLGPVSGLDLLPELRDRHGTPIPVIVFSAHAAELATNPQVEANLNKGSASLKDLVGAVHDRLMLRSAAKETV